MKFYYFGCIGCAGHYLWDIDERWVATHWKEATPWGYDLDSKLCIEGQQTEGIATLNHKDGWTAISFWDRSVDGRNGCNSTFIAEGTFSFTEMMGFAKQYYPKILDRFNFDVTYKDPNEGKE